MNCQDDFTFSEEILEYLTQEGLDALPRVIRTLVNEAILMERNKYIGVQPYERSMQRRDRANGFNDLPNAGAVGMCWRMWALWLN